ncbi:amino acid ABC transporter permease [Terasakiella pusilla]|uniref:amino acid ABC transporter permease n=1 Tax=Terasakiella pusilla TaxID=64973 RepID=UPI003AA81399
MENFDFGVIIDAAPLLVDGMQVTLLLTLAAIVGGIVGGTLLALCRLSPYRTLSLMASGYVNFLRSMPLILVIFWFYFLVPLIVGRPIGGYYSVLIAFIMFESAYYCEIIRAGIQSVSRGQEMASKALGLNYWQRMRFIVLPQAFRNMVPVLLTQGIVLFQDTSLVYVVGVHDFLVSADIVANRDNRLIEMYTTVALVYFAISTMGSLTVRALQKRLTT